MSFAGLLIDKMKIIQITNPGEWSEPVEAVGDPIPCRIMYDTRLMKNYQGEEVLSAAKIFVKAEHITFGHEDGLQLDIESYAKNHPIITIKQPQNSVILHHAEVWIQ